MTTESKIEQRLIDKLVDLKYTYRQDIRDRAALEHNFREKFQQLNKVNLSDSEFARLRDDIVTSDVYSAAKRLREYGTFEREDGTPLHYSLVNIKDWCKNSFEVINQLRINTESSFHRYDVILLMNGLPVVQIELKTYEISPRKAMQQIVDYKNDPGNGYGNTLLCFMQLFIVSNQNKTLYFANNSNRHFSFNADEKFLPVYQFADKANKKINDLDDFSKKFLEKCTLGNMISRYMVLVASEQKLMIMRPYQIYAVEAIVDCIHQNRGNGYIWHTTGSGKTLTSFKASTLLKDNPDIEKCLFVVDRKDLDRQTREEFNKFQEGCVEENTHTGALVERMLSREYADKVIVTTIQKLGLALDGTNKKQYKEQLSALAKQRVVFIFDECHRSQFGENHKAIRDFFPKAQLFGFTGTPIFEENASYKQTEGDEKTLVTTEKIFQKELHAYTITHAIEDRNVLRFHVDYFEPEDETKQTSTSEFATRKAIAEAILEKHDISTAQRTFNAVFATASINNAIEYYYLFKDLQKSLAEQNEDYKPLNIACVFSPPADGNMDVRQIQEDLPQEKADNEEQPEEKKAALKAIIKDYNAQYKTNHDINNFDGYYKDLQKRIKDQQYPESDLKHEEKIDITIVVDMLLTGFDSKYLNTLYVDKNLKYHGLIQAFSRTNRVLNDTKPEGNILDFRGQQNEVDAAIELFSGVDIEKARKIWLVEPAEEVIFQLDCAVGALDIFMQKQGLQCTPAEVANLAGDTARAEFINLFKEVQRIKTRIDQYTDLLPDQKAHIEDLMDRDKLRGFRGVYLDLARDLRSQQNKMETPADIEQLDFEFVLFASAIIDYDYIMKLIARFSHEKSERWDSTRDQLISLIKSDARFLDERDEIKAYVNSLQAGRGFTEAEIKDGYEKFKKELFAREIQTIARNHGLSASPLEEFVEEIMSRMVFDAEKLSDLMAPLELGWKERAQKEMVLMQALIPLLKKLARGRDISGLGAYEQ